MKAAVVLLLATLLPLGALAAPAVGNPVVYHSTDGGTTPSAGLAAQDDQPLHLYIDYANQPDVGESGGSGTLCVNEDGDETCAFDVLLVMTTDAATFDDFTPGPEGSIVGHIEDPARTTLRVNGIATAGMQIPAFIGTLTVDAAEAHELQVRAVGVHRVGAAGQMDAIQPQVVVNLPEPGRLLLLASGVATLAALHRLRRWRRRGPV